MMLPDTGRALDEVGQSHTGVDGSGGGAPRLRRRVAGAMAMLAAWWALAASTAMARDPEPALRIPLESMGYQTIVPEFLLSGNSMLTVHFVDKEHLLITFNVRRLMKREFDPPPDDDDRTVGAFLVELPSGKVLARTEWRVHDHSQYIWSLGHGRFLLRVRDSLTTFAPLESADANDAFREVPLLQLDRRIVAVLVSSDGDLLTVETTKQPAGPAGAAGKSSRDQVARDPAPVQINFYRLSSTSADDVRAVSAGAIRTRSAVAMPMTTAGFLDVLEGGKNRWLFNFDEHTGKVNELSPFDTTCFPRPTFVGHSEFVAFGCRGSTDRQDLAGFNLKGEEMWQQKFFDTHVSPTFAFAPAAGRFALGRIIVSGAIDPDSILPASVVNAQEVRVYQSYDGKQLFRIECSPVQRAGQNFALSADGLRLAVVRETTLRHAGTKDYDAYTQRQAAVEVYALPQLTQRDQAAVKEAAALAPADSGARIDLSLRRISAPVATETASGPNGVSSSAVDLSAAAPVSPANETAAATGTEKGTDAVGDLGPGAVREPPTLYGPGEKPAGKSPQPKSPE